VKPGVVRCSSSMAERSTPSGSPALNVPVKSILTDWAEEKMPCECHPANPSDERPPSCDKERTMLCFGKIDICLQAVSFLRNTSQNCCLIEPFIIGGIELIHQPRGGTHQIRLRLRTDRNHTGQTAGNGAEKAHEYLLIKFGKLDLCRSDHTTNSNLHENTLWTENRWKQLSEGQQKPTRPGKFSA